LRVTLEKARRWERLAAALWEECVGGDKEKRIKPHNSKPCKRSNKASCKRIIALLAPVWTHEATA
jgi:hypothetical protein